MAPHGRNSWSRLRASGATGIRTQDRQGAHFGFNPEPDQLSPSATPATLVPSINGHEFPVTRSRGVVGTRHARRSGTATGPLGSRGLQHEDYSTSALLSTSDVEERVVGPVDGALVVYPVPFALAAGPEVAGSVVGRV